MPELWPGAEPDVYVIFISPWSLSPGLLDAHWEEEGPRVQPPGVASKMPSSLS